MNIREESARCLLCSDAPCSKVCPSGDPARAIRAVRFDNVAIASQWLCQCTDEDLQRAEAACIHYDRPIRIAEMARQLKQASPSAVDCKCPADAGEAPANPGLSIDFCGIRCESPFFLASSAVCTNYDMVARAFDAGWAGVFFKTICVDDIHEVSPRFDAVGRPFTGFRNMEQLSENPVEEDFDTLRRLKRDYPQKVVIASIMGKAEEEWISLAKMAQEAGADAVELNFSCPQMRLSGMGSDVGQNPELVLFYTAYVKRNVSIPVIAKMTPNITHINDPAMSAFYAGADAISAINTIKSVTLGPGSEVSAKQTISGYSGHAVKPIALRYILEMANNDIMHTHRDVQLSGIGGIETWRDALEFIQLGCRNVQVCTAVMQYGYRIIDDLTLGLSHYMSERGVSRLADLVGERLSQFVTPTDLDRETIVYPRIDRSRCIGCGRCYTSCMDGGHQAIAFGDDRQPRIIGTKCVGCHLCRLVCPTEAIGLTKRTQKH